ncbi:hypothetical protein ACR77J_07825 [Tissierella praeacuta]|uniref:hypothetical protein n=1 Tax=Tissierella praeacuta TaxID=43131 RepID=UPI003DA21BE9
MKIDNTNLVDYEKAFNKKINSLNNHKRYSWLKEYANEVLMYHTDYGFNGIKARDFMKRIIEMPISYIEGWLDGKNNLKWIDNY